MSTSLPLLLEPQELATQLTSEKLLIIDLSSDKVHQQAHVPGALHLTPNQLLAGEQPAPGKLPSAKALSTVFSILGLTPDHHVVAYDDEGGGWAGRLIWTLDMIGHKNYSYLNGGIHAWLAEGLLTEQGTNSPLATIYQANIDENGPSVDVDYLTAHFQDDDLQIWDARSTDEFVGARMFAQRGGHIPGAAHYEWTTAMDRNNNLKIRDLETVKQELANIGIDNSKTVITHCQTHHRSGFTYLVGKLLGMNIKAYPGSWSEWGNLTDTPVEAED